MKPTDLRGILHYVPQFRERVFLIAVDGSVVADENFGNLLLDIAVLRSLNIHIVLDRVQKLALTGFARHIKFVDVYDPSLPPVLGNRDQLIQVFLNLVKNAAEAIGENAPDGQIELTTAFRPGVRLSVPGSKTRVSLPLEFCVRDNGPGVPEDLMPHLFDPFVTTKPTGTGLGLALVAKIVGDHGGIIECESQPRHTIFRVLMPMFTGDDASPGGVA